HAWGGDAFLFPCRERAREDGCGDQGQWHAEVAGRDHGPLAGAFLASGIEDQVDHWLAGFGVAETENIASDLDQVAVEWSAVPASEDIVHGGRFHSEHGPHHVVGLADELHVAIFDSVVDHLYEVPGAFGPDPVAARGSVGDFGGNGLEDRLDVRPGVGVSARHDRGPMQRAFLAARNSRADEQDALFLELSGSAGRIRVVRIASVDQDVAWLQQRNQLVDDFINRRACLDHDHDLARSLEAGDELLHRMCAYDRLAPGAPGQEPIDLGGRPVEHGD